MELRKDLPLHSKVLKTGGCYAFRVPKVLIDIGYIKEGVFYRIWFEEVEK